MDPCIKCTRSKLDTGQGLLGLVAPEDLLSACCPVLPLVLSALVLSPFVLSTLVSSCPFPSGLLPVGLQGLSWASPGPLSGIILGFLVALGAPGASWGGLGVLLGCSWRLLGLSWIALGLSWSALGPLLGTLGQSFGSLGRLLAAQTDFPRNPAKTIIFLCR